MWLDAHMKYMPSDLASLTALLDAVQVSTLRDAASRCEGQRYPLEAAGQDEYRRGQYRGANDCATVLGRLADHIEARGTRVIPGARS